MKTLILHLLLGHIVGIIGGDVSETLFEIGPVEYEEPEKYSKNPYYFNFGSKHTICPTNATCLDGKFNFLCAPEPMKISKQCKRFLPIRNTHRSTLKMVHVHNGLRNKVARSYKVSNMNLVYWNIHLQNMAEQYLHLCRPYQDTCRIIGTDGYEVGQNWLYVRRHRAAILNEWEGRTVRHWVMDLFSTFHFRHAVNDSREQPDHVRFLVQVMMPRLEFIGCGAAIMFKGFFIVCYYFPPAKGKLSSQLTYLLPNETCVCPEERHLCSSLFTSLCGIDIHKSATIIELSGLNVFLAIFLLLVCFVS